MKRRAPVKTPWGTGGSIVGDTLSVLQVRRTAAWPATQMLIDLYYPDRAGESVVTYWQGIWSTFHDPPLQDGEPFWNDLFWINLFEELSGVRRSEVHDVGGGHIHIFPIQEFACLENPPLAGPPPPEILEAQRERDALIASASGSK